MEADISTLNLGKIRDEYEHGDPSAFVSFAEFAVATGSIFVRSGYREAMHSAIVSGHEPLKIIGSQTQADLSNYSVEDFGEEFKVVKIAR